MKDIDRGYKAVIEKLKKLKNKVLQVGILKDAGQNEDGQYIADYALANEYGVGVPERSFMRSTADEKSAEWNKNIDKIVDKVIENPNVDTDVMIELLGAKIVGEIQEKISSNIPPPNSEATKKRKKSSRTLIDTGIMRSSINFEIVGK